MKFIIDRFEGEFAIVELENKKMIDMPIILLPPDAKEGDIINISIDQIETENKRKRIQDKFDSLISDE